jgi:hypothetical protein
VLKEDVVERLPLVALPLVAIALALPLARNLDNIGRAGEL